MGLNNKNYPSLEEVKNADKIKLAIWTRFLPSPGSIAIGKINFEVILNKECEIINLIHQRFSELGGMNSEISKQIGWDE